MVPHRTIPAPKTLLAGMVPAFKRLLVGIIPAPKTLFGGWIWMTQKMEGVVMNFGLLQLTFY